MSATEIGVVRDAGRPRLTLRSSLLAARVVNRTETGATVALVATSALLLGGDTVAIEVHVGAGCRLEVLEIAATVAYNAGGVQSSWLVTAVVEDGGVLLWHGEPLIAADGANVLRQQRVELVGSGVVGLRDCLVLGRTGERGGVVRAVTRVHRDGIPLLIEDLDLDGGCRHDLLTGRRVIDTVSLLGRRAPGGGPGPGERFDLDGPGTVGRAMRDDAAGSPVTGWAAEWFGHARSPADR